MVTPGPVGALCRLGRRRPRPSCAARRGADHIPCSRWASPGVSLAALAAVALAGTDRYACARSSSGAERPAQSTRRRDLELALAAATLGMVSLRLGGPRQGGGWDPVLRLVPALAVLVGGLLAARALPALAGGLMRANAGLGPWPPTSPPGRLFAAAQRRAAGRGPADRRLRVGQRRYDRASGQRQPPRPPGPRSAQPVPSRSAFPGRVTGRSIAAVADPGGRQLRRGCGPGPRWPSSGTPFTLSGRPRPVRNVAFWREDFARQPLAGCSPAATARQILPPELDRPPRSRSGYGRLGGVLDATELTAELLSVGTGASSRCPRTGPAGQARLPRGREPGRGRRSRRSPTGCCGCGCIESEDLAGVTGVHRFEAAWARQGGRWRPVGGFAPGRWYVRGAQGRRSPRRPPVAECLVLALHRDPTLGSRSPPRRSLKELPRWSPPAC